MIKCETKKNFPIFLGVHTKKCLLQLLLGAQVVSMSTLLLAAIGSSWVKTSITLAAYHFVTVVFLGQNTEGRFNNTTTKTQYQVQSRL